jgi:hypothetical protein
MADDFITTEVKGLAELQASLEQLPAEIGRACVKDALTAGGKAMQQAMIEGSTSIKGEAGERLRTLSAWSRTVKMLSELAGRVRVGPKGSLDEPHKSRGKGMQPLGRIYERSLAYIVKMAEFSGKNPAVNVGRSTPMTSGWESHTSEIQDAVTDSLKTGIEKVAAQHTTHNILP